MSFKALNDTAERAVKRMQEFRGLITAEKHRKNFNFDSSLSNKEKYYFRSGCSLKSITIKRRP